MRLIDADKLYDWVRSECNPYGKPTIDFESGNRMLDMIKRSSTAFDREKVIEELYRYTAEECELHECGIRSEYCNVCMAKKAIEIIEKGGIE